MAGKKMRGVRGDDTAFIIGAGKFADRVERFPKSNRNEFYFVRAVLAQNITALVAGDAMNPGKNAREKHVVVGAGVLRPGIAVPKSRDHEPTLAARPRADLHFPAHLLIRAVTPAKVSRNV